MNRRTIHAPDRIHRASPPGNPVAAPVPDDDSGAERTGLQQSSAHSSARFRSVVLSNLDAAHNLAWWLTRDEHEAADVVQEACLKAWRFFGDYRGGDGGDGKAWLLRIVRTTVAGRARSPQRRVRSMDEDGPNETGTAAREAAPIAPLLRAADARMIEEAIASLPETLREVLVLRDVEGLTYAQIAAVLELPAGTVMSRLSRARDAARDALLARMPKE